jgi:multicomponent Na+:H+ antiporter subunit G
MTPSGGAADESRFRRSQHHRDRRRRLFLLRWHSGVAAVSDALTRLHALTKADNLGLGLVVFGLLPRTGSLLASLKLIAIWALIQLASATTAQLIARAARRKGPAA